LVLLGPAHLVPAGFWDAAQSLLEPRGSLGPQSLCCFQVPVVTTVPITQVKPIAAIIVPATTSVPFSDEELTGAACRMGQNVADIAQTARRGPAAAAALSRAKRHHVCPYRIRLRNNRLPINVFSCTQRSRPRPSGSAA
jgi:hypothetical protein